MRHLRTTAFDFATVRPPTCRRVDGDVDHKPDRVCRLGHLSDLHLGKRPEDDRPGSETLRRWLEAFEGAGVDLLAVTGDLVERPGDRPRLQRARRLLEEASFRWVVVPGNHDVDHPGKKGAFEEVFGDFPRLERCTGLDLLLFDSMRGLPVDKRTDKERRDADNRGAFSRGRVGDEQRDSIEQDLGEAPRFGRVVLTHHHLRYNAPTPTGWQEDPAAPDGLMAPLDDARRHLQWAARHARLVLHGHKHNGWDPYVPLPGLVVLNSGTAVQAKPGRPRRGRIIDITPNMDALFVHDVSL